MHPEFYLTANKRNRFRILFSVLMLCFMFNFFLFSNPGFAQTKKDKDFLQQADELSYEGQLKKAESLLKNKKEEENSDSAKSSIDENTIILSMLWGAFGAGFFIFGKKQSRATFLVCGIALCAFPLFVSGFYLSLLLGISMLTLPFLVKI